MSRSQSFSQLQKGHVAPFTSRGHQTAALVYLQSMQGVIGYLDAEQRRTLLVQNVPRVQTPIHTRGEEDGGTGGTPTSIGQIFGVRTSPHDGGFLDVFRPNARAPVPNRQEILGETWVALQGIDRAEVGIVNGWYAFIDGFSFFVA